MPAPVQVVDPSIDGAVNVVRAEVCVASCRQTQTARWRQTKSEVVCEFHSGRDELINCGVVSSSLSTVARDVAKTALCRCSPESHPVPAKAVSFLATILEQIAWLTFKCPAQRTERRHINSRLPALDQPAEVCRVQPCFFSQGPPGPKALLSHHFEYFELDHFALPPLQVVSIDYTHAGSGFQPLYTKSPPFCSLSNWVDCAWEVRPDGPLSMSHILTPGLGTF